MPTRRGPAAVGGPERLLHDHRFVGPDVSLLPAQDFPGYVEMREAARELLAERTLEMSALYVASEQTLVVRLENQAGHALPTGATSDRQLWIEVRITDLTSGREVFSSGMLDERGDLLPDPQLSHFHQRLLSNGDEVDFVWQASAFEERLIGALERITLRYDLSQLSPGRYHATVRVRLRPFAPHLLRTLVEQADLDEAVAERLPIFELGARQLDLER